MVWPGLYLSPGAALVSLGTQRWWTIVQVASPVLTQLVIWPITVDQGEKRIAILNQLPPLSEGSDWYCRGADPMRRLTKAEEGKAEVIGEVACYQLPRSGKPCLLKPKTSGKSLAGSTGKQLLWEHNDNQNLI